MTTLLFDYDPILYECGFIGETRHVKIVHRESGDEYEFPNRTAFYGHWKKKAGGWLAEYNAGRTTPRQVDEFDYTDVQVAEPIENCLHTMKRIIQGLKEVTEADRYYGYSGKGDSFRLGVSTVLKYKGNRDGMLRPIHLNDLKEYLIKHHACKIVQNIEADDACSIDLYTSYKKWKKTKSSDDKVVLAYVDKDYLQCAGHLYNTHNQDGIDSYDGFGWLQIEGEGSKAKVKGRGRMWLYQQVMSGDDADNYCANSASSMKWGDKSAYAVLKDAKNDKEAFEALVRGYKTLYPQPKTIKGWRGDDIEVDWLYMLQENMTLAFMLRKLDDKINVKEVMDNLGVDYNAIEG
jgi:hypothetical protein